MQLYALAYEIIVNVFLYYVGLHDLGTLFGILQDGK